MLALTFADAVFPSNKNVHLWLKSQGQKHELGDMAVRGRYAIRHSKRSAIVVLYRELVDGVAPDARALRDPALEEVELDQGVKGYRYRTQEGTDDEADTA